MYAYRTYLVQAAEADLAAILLAVAVSAAAAAASVFPERPRVSLPITVVTDSKNYHAYAWILLVTGQYCIWSSW
jgi:hypothetical protein